MFFHNKGQMIPVYRVVCGEATFPSPGEKERALARRCNTLQTGIFFHLVAYYRPLWYDIRYKTITNNHLPEMEI